jgi:hypothetical protein
MILLCLDDINKVSMSYRKNLFEILYGTNATDFILHQLKFNK